MSSSIEPENILMNPSWDIFTPELLDLSTVEREYVEFREQNVVNSSTLTNYIIETKDKDSFIEPHMGYLEVKYRFTSDIAGAPIPRNDKIALQNHGLSLFQNCEYMIEDQRIEYLDEPSMAWTVKNITDFSRQHGDSIASTEGFYLDTSSVASLKNCNVRFFNQTNPRIGVELFFQTNANNPSQLVPTVASNNATWRNNDTVIALLNSEYPFPASIAPVVAAAVVPVGYPTLINFFLGEANITLNLTGVDGQNNELGQLTGIGVAANPGEVTAISNNGYEVFPFINPTAIPFVGTLIPAKFRRDAASGTVFSLYYPVIAQAAGISVVFGSNHPDTYNQGFQKRYDQAIRSASANTGKETYHSLWIPLKNIFMFCRAYDKISRGLRHRVVFNRNTDNNAILRNATTPANRLFSLEYISMWIPRLKPSLQVLKQIEEKLLSNSSYLVNFTDLTCWHTNEIGATNGAQVAYQLATTVKKPVRIWVAFQLKSRFEGGQLTNKRVFDHLNTQAIQVRLNQQLFPLYEYKFDNRVPAAPPLYPPSGTITGANELLNYQRAYTALIAAAYKNRDSMDGSLITYEQWASLYPIYYFDLTAQPEDLYKTAKYSEMEIRWTNGSTLPYYAYIIYESERQLMIRGVGGNMSISL
jgi:hypothetical protein